MEAYREQWGCFRRSHLSALPIPCIAESTQPGGIGKPKVPPFV